MAGPEFVRQLADALISAETGSDLVNILRGQLEMLAALPAALYLVDEEAGVLYQAVNLDSELPEEMGIDQIMVTDAQRQILYYNGDPVGLLMSEQNIEVHRAEMEFIAAILAPSLEAVQHNEATRRELRRLHERMHLLISAGQLLRELNIESLLVRIVETLLKSVNAQVGAICTPNESGELIIQTTWGLTEEHVDAMSLRSQPKRVIDHVFTEKDVLCLNEEQCAADIDLGDLSVNLTGLLALPLMSGMHCLGVALVANPAEHFNESNRELGETVCHMAAIALENAQLVKATVDRERLHRDLEIAKTVQNSMFPNADLNHDRISVSGDSRPCDETGGDYYTYMTRDNKMLVMIGDVTGHGLGAALYTTMAHAVVQQQLLSGASIGPAIEAVSMALGHTNSERFMTAVLMEINPETKEFSYVSAGHNPLLWIRKDGSTQWLDSTGMPMGIIPDCSFDVSPVHSYAEGDCIVFYTDGFPEAADASGDFYGEDRFEAVMVEAVKEGKKAAEIKAVMYEEIDRFLGIAAPDDDLTLTIVTL